MVNYIQQKEIIANQFFVVVVGPMIKENKEKTTAEKL